MKCVNHIKNEYMLVRVDGKPEWREWVVGFVPGTQQRAPQPVLQDGEQLYTDITGYHEIVRGLL